MVIKWTVMKNRKAYENTLSIILDEPDIKMEEVKVEQVILNRFLNMASKNGSKELISLLQYMKDTRLDNPEIKVKDERLIELDRIVSEVKESEEWEAVEMNILEVGISNGEMKKLVSI